MKEIENLLKEILEQVHEFRSDYVSNEQAVRTQLIEPVLNSLGWKTANPKFVRPNAPGEDGKIPDYTLLKNEKKTLIVEAKNLSVDLQNKNMIDQLAHYCFNLGIDFGVLTNGLKWLLFKTFEKNPKDRIVWQVDLEKDKIENVAKRLSSFAYSNIDTLDSLLKKSKLLEEGWKAMVVSTDNIVTIMSQKLLEKIKSTEPTFKIDVNDLKTFVRGKIEELFELIENEVDSENPANKTSLEFEEVEDVIFKRHQKTKIREKVKVKFPDSTEVNYKKVIDTFVETIKRIGPEKILPLNISRAGVPIVSETSDDFYNQHTIGKYYIMAHTSTREKVAVLNEINERLNLKLIIETYVN